LKHYWPKAESFNDITKSDFTKYANTIDILTGGFPCQPYSSAGKRLGKEDERHLWPEMLRAIREIAPRFVVGENVRGLTNWNGGLVFDEVCAELENIGYQVAPVVIPACAVNAPHKRERIWFVAANTNPTRFHEQHISTKSNKKMSCRRSSNERGNFTRFPTQSPICGGDDGIPDRLDNITISKWRNESIKAYGNAIVPHVALEIFKAIERVDNEML
jgi:DNA (cytosine-5)-methyltransferase 1